MAERVLLPLTDLPLPLALMLRAKAKQWFGFSPWRTIELTAVNRAWCAPQRLDEPVIPLHLPVGLDLAARFLAVRMMVDGPGGFVWQWAIGYGHAISRWELRSGFGPDSKRTIRCFSHLERPGGWLTTVPALEQVDPAGEQSAALAMRACMLKVLND